MLHFNLCQQGTTIECTNCVKNLDLAVIQKKFNFYITIHITILLPKTQPKTVDEDNLDATYYKYF